MSYSIETKLEVVNLLLGGYSLRRLSRERHMDHHTLREWRARYLLHGRRGLLPGNHRRRFTPEEKASILREFIEKRVPLLELCVTHDVCRSTVKGWARAQRKSGETPRREKRRTGQTGKMGRPKKREPQTELEKLQAENLRLRAENALLKKVKALVEAKQAQARRPGRKPSTD